MKVDLEQDVIIELIGPMGVGKTTVAPLVAERLHMRHVRGQAYHGLDDRPLSPSQQWADRLVSSLRNPRLTIQALRVHPDEVRGRLDFAWNLVRRNRLEVRADRVGGGLVESGMVHAISQIAAWYDETDFTPLARHIFKADFYVRLSTSPDEVTRRLDSRKEYPEEAIAEYDTWIERYEWTVDRILAGIDRPVIEVDAGGPPDAVVELIVSGLSPLLRP